MRLVAGNIRFKLLLRGQKRRYRESDEDEDDTQDEHHDFATDLVRAA